MGAIRRPYPGRVRRAKRIKSALELYDSGKSFGTIAKLVGVSRGEAYRLVQDGLLEVRLNPEEVAVRRAQQVSLIESLLEPLVPGARKGDTNTSREVRGYLSMLIQLTGTAAPTKQEIEGPAPVTIINNEAPSAQDMARLVREAFGSHAAVKQDAGPAEAAGDPGAESVSADPAGGGVRGPQ